MTKSATHRRLEGIERLAAIGNAFYHGCYNMIAMLEIEGPMTAELIQCSLEHIQQKFECLQVEVIQESSHGQQWVFKHTAEIIKLETVNSTHPEHYLKIWNELSSARLDGLPWRITWIHQAGNNKSYLFGLFHHAIFDGMSMAIFFDSLLQVMHQFTEGHVEAPIAQSILPPAHQFAKARWPLIALARIGYYRYLRRLRSIAFDPRGEIVEHRRWHSVFRILENDKVEDLLTRCRRQSVKIENAFSAAIVLEVAELVRQHETKPFDLALYTTVDLRRYNTQSQVAPLIGVLCSAIPSYFRPHAKHTLWQVAQHAARQLQRSIWRREDRNLSLMHSFLGPKVAAWQIHHNQGRPLEGTLAVTNMGRFSGFEHGPFRMTAVHSMPLQAVWGCTFFLGFITVRGRLCITLGYPYPSVADTLAESIMDGILHRLFV